VYKQAVILIEFDELTDETSDDTKFSKENPAEYYDRLFNEPGFSERHSKGCVADYYREQSGGLLNLSFDVYGPITVHQKAQPYDEPDARTRNYDRESFVEATKKVIDATPDINWKQYDWNGDGYVNQLLILFPGKGQNDGGGTNSIWPHQLRLSWHLKDRQEGVYCEPRMVEYDGKTFAVDSYCAVNELAGNGGYGTFGTICHEYSHCFGLPDFYYGSVSVLKNWDLMDSGNYNEDGFRPCGYSAHERWLMGWLTPIECAENMTVSDMPALCDEPQAYLLRNDAYDNEYYILENRQQRGWDAALPGSGIVVFHIDYDKEVWEGITEWPNGGSLKRYTIVPANNNSSTYTAAKWPYPFESNNELTNTSKPAATLNHPNSDGTKLLSKPVTGMTLTDGLASFEVMKDPTAVTERQVNTKPKVLYDLGPIHIIRFANGEIKKVMKH
jgi:M6 family metalloprotease-like protein